MPHCLILTNSINEGEQGWACFIVLILINKLFFRKKEERGADSESEGIKYPQLRWHWWLVQSDYKLCPSYYYI